MEDLRLGLDREGAGRARELQHQEDDGDELARKSQNRRNHLDHRTEHDARKEDQRIVGSDVNDVKSQGELHDQPQNDRLQSSDDEPGNEP